ncbi:MAG: SRPBCC domain-containing protein [Caulobacter sp.]|nr:SRPBCC domain-containing protein [Caulobacter sp.]
MKSILIAAALLIGLTAAPAHAEVKATWAAGFRLEDRVTIAASPEAVWEALGRIGGWWDGAHSYSGDAANMTMPLRPGGCFCEALPGGGVKHGEVIMVLPGKALRIAAALGPLQEEGVSAALTFTLTPAADGGTEVVMTYNVGGARPEIVAIAPVVDGVVGGQLVRLKALVETGAPTP